MKKVLLVLLSALTLSSSSTPLLSEDSNESHWTPFMVAPNGFVVWSARNFKSVVPRDKFTYEVRMDFAPGHELTFGQSKIHHVDFMILSSCESNTQVIVTEAISDNAKIIKYNDSPELVIAPPGTVPETVMQSICSSVDLINKSLLDT